jgi:hypothetical protein
MDLDELKPLDLAMHGLDERALAHAACAPQQRIVGGQPPREALRVGKERIAHAVDALEQRKRHAVDIGNGQEGLRLGLPHEGVACLEVGRLGLVRAKSLDRPGDPLDQP